MDFATIGELPKLTGGTLFRYTWMESHEELLGDLRTAFQLEGFDAQFVVRCSNGVRPFEHIGHFLEKAGHTVFISSIDAHTTITTSLVLEKLLKVEDGCYFQAALLYTAMNGERRIRVHNLKLEVVSEIHRVFRLASLEPTITFLAKEAVRVARQGSVNEVREKLTEKCINILLAYRKECATGFSPNQFVLPEVFKLLPIYLLALCKTAALHGKLTDIDYRIWCMDRIEGISTERLLPLLYPRIIPLHDQLIADECSLSDLKPIAASFTKFLPDRAYLMDNGEKVYLWLGSEMAASFMEGLGVANTTFFLSCQVDQKTPHQIQLLNWYLERLNRYLGIKRAGVYLVWAERTTWESSNIFVEDAITDSVNYEDYLSAIHQRIYNEIRTSLQNRASGGFTPRWQQWY